MKTHPSSPDSIQEAEEQVLAYRRTYYQRNKERITIRRKEYYQSHKAEIAAVNKVWRQKNAESLRQSSKDYYQSHKEETSKRQHRYRQEHREEISTKAKQKYLLEKKQNIERSKAYYRTHQEERKAYQRELYRKNPEYSQEYHKTHQTTPEQRGTKPILSPNPDSPTQRAKRLGISRQRMDQLLHPERHQARCQLQNAVKIGKIIKPETCEICWNKKFLHGHHSDYSKPLDVTWLCVRCHHDIHKKQRVVVQFEFDRLDSQALTYG